MDNYDSLGYLQISLQIINLDLWQTQPLLLIMKLTGMKFCFLCLTVCDLMCLHVCVTDQGVSNMQHFVNILNFIGFHLGHCRQ